MSTYLGQSASKAISSEEDLGDYFHPFAKSQKGSLVGLEAEFLGVHKGSGLALPYEGPSGIQTVLKVLANNFSYEPILEAQKIIALKRSDTYVTLEPGGQIELSAPPTANVFDIEKQIQSFLKDLRAVRTIVKDIEWLAVGIQPYSSVSEISWVPKKRYAIMADYLKDRGTMAWKMMKVTATNQVNFDYLDEENAMTKLRIVLAVTSIVSAMFANSSFSEGQLNGYRTKRLEIWNHMDPDRSGLLLDFIREGRTFRDYLNYILDIPMMFIVRQGEWVPMKGITFRKFLKEGYQGAGATLDDFELHLSTAFPEARLKKYLEIRGTDCQRPELIPAVAAFWKGILYHPLAHQEVWDLVGHLSPEDRLRIHQEVPRKGLDTLLDGKPLWDFAEALVDISCASLARQKRNEADADECLFLKRIREAIFHPHQTPADKLIHYWTYLPHKNPSRLIEYLSIG